MIGYVQNGKPPQGWTDNRMNDTQASERQALVQKDTIERSPDALSNEVEGCNLCQQNLFSQSMKFLALIPKAVSQFCSNHCMEDEQSINEQELDEPEVTDCYMQ